MTDEKPKPCPWCNGKRTRFYGHPGGLHWLACMNERCSAVGPNATTKDDAVKAWNKAPREGER